MNTVLNHPRLLNMVLYLLSWVMRVSCCLYFTIFLFFTVLRASDKYFANASSSSRKNGSSSVNNTHQALGSSWCWRSRTWNHHVLMVAVVARNSRKAIDRKSSSSKKEDRKNSGHVVAMIVWHYYLCCWENEWTRCCSCCCCRQEVEWCKRVREVARICYQAATTTSTR